MVLEGEGFMSCNIKTGYELRNTQWMNEDEYEKTKWVSLSWLREQIQKEIDNASEIKKPTFQIDHSYQAGLNAVLVLLEAEEKQ